MHVQDKNQYVASRMLNGSTVLMVLVSVSSESNTVNSMPSGLVTLAPVQDDSYMISSWFITLARPAG